LTINYELLDAGVLGVNVVKIDSGSGVKEVDLYQILPGNSCVVLLLKRIGGGRGFVGHLVLYVRTGSISEDSIHQNL
jgi:hypothetical protein